ncbi:MAG: SDR family oxidoreductase [Planctomycetaceae bacterium]|nr:SDR family oxidoreductase [Planctomycetaceae bacterium]
MTTARPSPPFPGQNMEPPGLESRMNPRPEFKAAEYRAAGKLQGQVALITGGDSGIGRAVALLYARVGARVALVYLPEEQSDAEQTETAIREVMEGQAKEGGVGSSGVLLIPGDLTDPEFCRSAISQTVEEFGRLDILVNNAAYQQHLNGLEELSEEQWDHTFRTNIYGYFRMAKAALPHLKAGSCIINTGSITGLEGSGGLIDYSATKGAIHAFTKSLAQNLVEKGIRVNCVAPGPVWTPLNPAERSSEEIRDFGASQPYGRPAQPEEIAPAYVFFASNADSGYITGEVLTLLGGETRAG